MILFGESLAHTLPVIPVMPGQKVKLFQKSAGTNRFLFIMEYTSMSKRVRNVALHNLDASPHSNRL